MTHADRVGRGPTGVLLVAIAAGGLLGCGTGLDEGSPAPTVAATSTATSTPTSTPTPSLQAGTSTAPLGTPGPWVLTDGPLVAHEYFTHPFGAPNEGMTFTFEVPDGWAGFESVGVLPESGSAGPTGMGIGFGLIERLYSDPCKAEFTTGFNVGDIEPGPTVDDLAAAFQEVTAYEASAPVDVELAGYSGKKVDLQLPVEYDCALDSFRPWEGSIYSQGPGDRWHLWILDVEGVRVVVLARDFAATPDEDRAELQAIVDSLRITP